MRSIYGVVMGGAVPGWLLGWAGLVLAERFTEVSFLSFSCWSWRAGACYINRYENPLLGYLFASQNCPI